MRTYLDTSVLLAVAFGERPRLPGWAALEQPVASELARVEALRSLDRRRAQGLLALSELVIRRGFVLELLEAIELVEVSRPVLARAAEPFPTPLRTLDAIHLSTAILLAGEGRMQFATHDVELGAAARSVGLTVIGV